MSSLESLTITDERHGEVIVVRCVGEVDLATVGQLREKLQSLQVDGPSRLVLVLDDVTFMDSLGLGALIGAYKRAKVLQGSMELVCTSTPVLNVLRATSLDRVFRIHDDLDGALAGELV